MEKVNLRKMSRRNARYDIVLCGSCGVGKSALLTSTFNSGLFNEEYDPTVQDIYNKSVHWADGTLHIVDTGGGQEYKQWQDLGAKTGKGFIMVYSITSQQTFNDIKKIKQEIVDTNGDDAVPMVVVGNKVDLDRTREVAMAEGDSLAKSWRCPFIESSAKNDTYVKEIFITIVTEIKSAAQAKKEENRQTKSDAGDCCVIL